MRGSLARIQLIEAPAIVKSGSPGAPRLTARLGYEQQRRPARRQPDHRVGVSWQRPVRLAAPF
jgi:hypothetical protein